MTSEAHSLQFSVHTAASCFGTHPASCFPAVPDLKSDLLYWCSFFHLWLKTESRPLWAAVRRSCHSYDWWCENTRSLDKSTLEIYSYEIWWICGRIMSQKLRLLFLLRSPEIRIASHSQISSAAFTSSRRASARCNNRPEDSACGGAADGFYKESWSWKRLCTYGKNIFRAR